MSTIIAPLDAQSKNQAAIHDDLTDRRIHEHLTNKNDVITEEDIRNVKTTIEMSAEESLEDKL